MTHLHKSLVVTASILALSCPAVAMAQSEAPQAGSDELDNRGEIIVTATRRDESILKAPVSVTAYSQEGLDVRGVKNIEDLARMTPGIAINQGTFGIKYLVIRGLTSSVGATMNGVYIDDVPVQVRSLSLTNNFYPAMFDLERVEVLRGPQGTLFGAGAMGGAVRFISAKPGFTDFSGYSRAEVATTEGGALSYEGGAAVGGPIIQDKLAFRVSGYYRRDGGYIDRIPWEPDWGTARKNHNSRDTYVGQAQLAFKPNEDSTVTAGVFYQQADRDNSDQFWDWRSKNVNRGTRPIELGGPKTPLAPVPLFVSRDGIDSYGRDRSILYSLKGEFDMGPATLISSTAYLDRRSRNYDDATAFFLDLLGADIDDTNYDTRSVVNLKMRTKAFTQELRVQSNPGESRLNYVAGVFFQNSRQFALEDDFSIDPAGITLFVPVPGLPVPGITVPLIPADPPGSGRVGYLDDRSRDQQFAVFGNIDYDLTDQLTISAGLRYSYVTFDFTSIAGFTARDVAGGRTSESPITPKFGIEYNPTDNLMFYASAGKGFRPGGSNPGFANAPPDCVTELQSLGYTSVPREYKSDTAWSYEIGAKGRVGSWLTFAGDIFQIDWSDVQRTRTLLACGNNFLDNLGKSRARGVEAKITITPVRGLALDANFSYTDATVRQTLLRPETFVPGIPGVTPDVTYPEDQIVTKGDRFAPPWIVSLAADYESELGSGGLVGYGRVQYDYRSGMVNPSGNIGYNVDYARIFTKEFVSTRLGVRSGGLNVSLFVDNLLDSKDELGRLALGSGERLLRQVYRPRTWGITASHRF